MTIITTILVVVCSQAKKLVRTAFTVKLQSTFFKHGIRRIRTTLPPPLLRARPAGIVKLAEGLKQRAHDRLDETRRRLASDEEMRNYANRRIKEASQGGLRVYEKAWLDRKDRVEEAKRRTAKHIPSALWRRKGSMYMWRRRAPEVAINGDGRPAWNGSTSVASSGRALKHSIHQRLPKDIAKGKGPPIEKVPVPRRNAAYPSQQHCGDQGKGEEKLSINFQHKHHCSHQLCDGCFCRIIFAAIWSDIAMTAKSTGV